jgi:hypothetical protein
VSIDLFEPSAGEPDASIVSGSVTTGPGSTMVLATPPAGRRVRLLSASLIYNFPPFAFANLDCPAHLSLTAGSGGQTIVQLAVAPKRPADAVEFLYDLPTDVALVSVVGAAWARVSLAYSVRYRIV